MIYGINNCWSTPVLYEKIDNEKIIDKLIEKILINYNLTQPPSELFNGNIFENKEIFGEFESKIVVPFFFKFFLQGFSMDLQDKNFWFRAWITGSQSGYSINNHNHSGATASAVFYLLVDRIDGGNIFLIDPRGNANRGYNQDLQIHFANQKITPKNNEVVIFPSYVYHFTDVFKGSLRLAIPVDIFLPD